MQSTAPRSYLCNMCHRDATCKIREVCVQRPRLNLACGLMIKPEHINFDRLSQSRNLNGTIYQTDILGECLDIHKIFKPNTFVEILAFHIFEHFFYEEVPKMLGNLLTILKPGGVLVIECPDLLGAYDILVKRDANIRKFAELILGVGQGARKAYKESGAAHRSAWTGDMMAVEMEMAGYKINHHGPGQSHGMGRRDFRIEGVKQ